MTTELVVLANPKPKYQRSSFFLPRVHDTIRSDQLTDENRLAHEPEEKNIPGNPESAFQRDSNILRVSSPSNKILHNFAKIFS